MTTATMPAPTTIARPRTLTVRATIVGQSPLSYSKVISSTKESGESHDAFEERTWKERIHTNNDGKLTIPPFAVKNMLAVTAKYLSETIPGKGKATYTKHFEAGILVVKPIELGISIDGVDSERLFVPSDGRKGGTTRVFKRFAFIPEWKGEVEIVLLDPILIERPDKVHEYLITAGQFIGFLRGRPRNGGHYGRFTVEDFRVV